MATRIARALCKSTNVLIFDEAINTLDNETEKDVMETIHVLDDDLTILLISHKLPAIEYCGKVFKLEGGRIAAERSFDNVVGSVENETGLIYSERKLHAV